ncbi:EamA family transporter, partial [Klebsiella pneumoniae]
LESILNATTPIFTVLVLHAATADERLTPLKGLGVALGFVGVILLVGPEALSGLASHAWAELICLGATFSYALALLYGRRFKGTP